MDPPLDHVALVVRQLEPVIERLVDLEPGPIEEFPSEGTREVYLGSDSARLLLMEPTDESGPYGRALVKRGPGLHHVAVSVTDLDSFLAKVTGWLVVPASVATVASSRTAWLARPGVATLLEVVEGEPALGPPTVEEVALPGPLPVDPRPSMVSSSDGEVWLMIAGTRHKVRVLAATTE